MSAVAITGLITALLTTVHEIAKKLPDFDEKEILEYEKLLNIFNMEVKKSYEDRDDDLILNLLDELKNKSVTIIEHLKKKEIAT